MLTRGYCLGRTVPTQPLSGFNPIRFPRPKLWGKAKSAAASEHGGIKCQPSGCMIIGQVLWKWEVLRGETIRGMHRDAVVKLRRGRRRGHGMLKVLPMGLTGWLWLMKMALWMLEWGQRAFLAGGILGENSRIVCICIAKTSKEKNTVSIVRNGDC